MTPWNAFRERSEQDLSSVPGSLAWNTPVIFFPQGTAYHRSCRSFFPHHARRIVRGAVIEDAITIHAAIRSAKMRAASRRATA